MLMYKCGVCFFSKSSSFKLTGQIKAIRPLNIISIDASEALSIFYRYFHGHYSQEIREIIPVPLRRVRTNRSSTHSHPFQVSLPNPRTLSHKSSFITRTCNLWNVLPSSCFPESYNLPSFKSKINKLHLISLSSSPFAFFFFPLLGLCIGHRGLSQHNSLKQIGLHCPFRR